MYQYTIELIVINNISSSAVLHWVGVWPLHCFAWVPPMEVRDVRGRSRHRTLLSTFWPKIIYQLYRWSICVQFPYNVSIPKFLQTDLRLPHRNDAKIAKFCNLWTFWIVIQLINHLFKIQKNAFCPTLLRWNLWSVGQNDFLSEVTLREVWIIMAAWTGHETH